MKLEITDFRQSTARICRKCGERSESYSGPFHDWRINRAMDEHQRKCKGIDPDVIAARCMVCEKPSKSTGSHTNGNIRNDFMECEDGHRFTRGTFLEPVILLGTGPKQ